MQHLLISRSEEKIFGLHLILVSSCSLMSSDDDSMLRITPLLQTGAFLRVSPYFYPCIISRIFMAVDGIRLLIFG
jgi:hypothetical protein